MTLVHPSMQQGYGRKNRIINGGMIVNQRMDNVVANLSKTATTAVDANAATTYTKNDAIGVTGGLTADTFTQGALNGANSVYYHLTGLVTGEIYKVSMFVKLGTATNFVVHANDSTLNSLPGTHTEAASTGGYGTNDYKEVSFVFTATATNSADIHFGINTLETGLATQTNGTVFIDEIKVTKAAVGTQSYAVDRFSALLSTANTDKFFCEQNLDATTKANTARLTMATAVTAPVSTDILQGITTALEGHDVHNLTGDMALSFNFNSNVSGTYSVAIQANNASDSYITNFTYNTPGVLTRFEFVVNANNKFVNSGNSLGCKISIGSFSTGAKSTSTTDAWVTGEYLNSTSATNWANAVDNFIEVNDVQLEDGSLATAFEHRPFANELQLCRRYYENLGQQYLSMYTSTYSFAHFRFSTQMRDTPTITRTDSASITFTAYYSHTDSQVEVFYHVNSPGSGDACVLIVDAEL